jgi:ribosomal protein S27AE
MVSHEEAYHLSHCLGCGALQRMMLHTDGPLAVCTKCAMTEWL